MCFHLFAISAESRAAEKTHRRARLGRQRKMMDTAHRASPPSLKPKLVYVYTNRENKHKNQEAGTTTRQSELRQGRERAKRQPARDDRRRPHSKRALRGRAIAEAHLGDEHGPDRLVEDGLEPALVQGGALEVLDRLDLLGHRPALRPRNPRRELLKFHFEPPHIARRVGPARHRGRCGRAGHLLRRDRLQALLTKLGDDAGLFPKIELGSD